MKRLLHLNYLLFSSIKFRVLRRIRRNGWFIFCCIVISAGLGIDTNLSLSYQIFSLLIAIVLVSMITLFCFRGRFKVRRTLPRYGSVGEEMIHEISIFNCGKNPQRGLGVFDLMADPRPTLEEFLNIPEPREKNRNIYDRFIGYYRWEWILEQKEMGHPREAGLPPIPPGEWREARSFITPLRRGVLSFAAVDVTWSDTFGLFRGFKRLRAGGSVIILPKRYPVGCAAIVGFNQYQPGGVALAGSVGESEEFVSLREYRPGDPYRKIHWKSWAKTGKPIVKEFQEEFFIRHALVLDTFAAAPGPDFEAAISVAASFAYHIQTQDSLLDLMFVGPEAYSFTAGRGVAHLEQMLEVLASVEVCRKYPFSTLEDEVFKHVAQISGCVCVLLRWDEERRSFVDKLSSMNVPTMVLVLGQKEKMDFSKSRLFQTDPESIRVVDPGRLEECLAAK